MSGEKRIEEQERDWEILSALIMNDDQTPQFRTLSKWLNAYHKITNQVNSIVRNIDRKCKFIPLHMTVRHCGALYSRPHT